MTAAAIQQVETPAAPVLTLVEPTPGIPYPHVHAIKFNAIHPSGVDCGEVAILDYYYEPADPDCGQGESYEVSDIFFDGRHCSFYSSGVGEFVHMPQWLIDQAAAHLESNGGF